MTKMLGVAVMKGPKRPPLAKTAAKVREAPIKRERGEPVIRRTMNATLHELARSGYAALKVEDIAEQAGVNKTTVYRRWPTKEALVRAALLSIARIQTVHSLPDTGSVREDLLIIGRRTLALTRSAEGQVAMRMVASESPHSELGKIAESVRSMHDAAPLAVLRRAQQRGQLRPNVQPALFFDVMRAACLQRIVLTGKLEAPYMEKLIDLLLPGALTSEAAAQLTKPRKARKRT